MKKTNIDSLPRRSAETGLYQERLNTLIIVYKTGFKCCTCFNVQVYDNSRDCLPSQSVCMQWSLFLPIEMAPGCGCVAGGGIKLTASVPLWDVPLSFLQDIQYG